MGGINFGWRCTAFVRRFGEAAAPGGGECGPCQGFASNTLAFALQLGEKPLVNRLSLAGT